MPERQQTPNSTAMLLGEMKAQLRELIHQGSNQAMKNDAAARAIAKLETLPDDIGEIKSGVAKLDKRVASLEARESRREGELGVFATALRSPLLAWIMAAVVVVLEWLKRHWQ